MAGEAQKRGRDEDYGDHDKAEIGLVRHQHVHRERAKAEIDDADRDLQQRQRTARQHHGPGAAADMARLGPDPDHIGDEREDDGDRDHAVEPGRQLVDRGGGLGMIGDAETEHRGIAEPEGQAGEEADFCDVDRIEPVARIDAVAHRAAGEDAGADIVADRIAREGCQRIDAVGDVAAADGADRKPVVESQREIAGGDEQSSERNLARLGALDGLDDLEGVDATEHMVEHIARDPDDGDADRNSQPVQDLLLAQNQDRSAYRFQHRVPRVRVRGRQASAVDRHSR